MAGHTFLANHDRTCYYNCKLYNQTYLLMKKLLPLLLMIPFVGCGDVLSEKHTELAKKHTEYFNKAQCMWNCGNTDSAIYYGDRMKKIYDTMAIVYKLMYPKKNPADKQDELKGNNCNCK